MARLIIATIGSLGDLHPMIALALGLRARGHRVELAAGEMYRAKIEALGLGFHPLGPDLLARGEHIVAAIMDGHRGTERLMREHLFPATREMHAALLPAIDGADALIASELVFPAAIFAEQGRVRWISYALAPVSFFSLHDPPTLPAPAPLRWIQRRARWLNRLVKWAGKVISHRWSRPIRELRAELGLPPGEHPLFEGKHSPRLSLALFSSVLQPPQPDWPPQTVQTGFLFHDEDSSGTGLRSVPPAAVENFLAAGDAPIVFTLGSAAVYLPGDFYRESVRAAERLGCRALLLLGKNAPPPNLPPTILAWDYLPYAQIFPRAAAIVHQGGVGTTAQALRAGRPMLVVPFAHDQFDNAARIERLGCGRTLARSRYRAANVARTLDLLLREPRYATSAAIFGRRVQDERGVESACDAIERALAP